MTEQRNCTRPVLRVLVLLMVCASMVLPAHAEIPVTVTVTINPASVDPGGSATVIVSATYEQVVTLSDSPESTLILPMSDASVALTTTSPGITFSPVSGTTDSQGKFSSVMIIPDGSSGSVLVHAILEKGGGYRGEGSSSVSVRAVPVTETETPVSGSNQQPVAHISTDRYAGKAPLTVVFDGQGSYDPDGSVNRYLWSFGDGGSAESYLVSHTYTTAGSWTATLTVVDNEGASSRQATAVITVYDPGTQPAATGRPAAIIEVNQSYGTAPLAVTFDGTKSLDLGGEIKDFYWDFGDGDIAHGPVTRHMFPDPGSYETRLTIYGPADQQLDYSTIGILVKPVPVAPGMTNAPPMTPPWITRTPGATPVVSPDPRTVAGESSDTVNRTAIPFQPARPAAGPSDLLPAAGVATGLLLGMASMVVTREKPASTEGKKIQEFLKNVLGRKGVALIAAWESKKFKTVIVHRKEVLLGLSFFEIFVAVISAALIGGAFYVARPNPDRFLFTLLLYISMAGIIVVLRDIAQRWVMRRHGRYGEYRFWPFGTIIMYITALVFGWACGKPSRHIFEKGEQRSPRDVAVECLAGPAVSCVLAVGFLFLLPFEGTARTIAVAGISINILLALYGLMPFEPMDGLKVWTWNRYVYLGIFIPLLMTYIAAGYLLV